MTRIETSLDDFPGLTIDEGTIPMLLVSPWGPVSAEVGDSTYVPDMGGAILMDLPPTGEDSRFSVQLSWLDRGTPRHKFMTITVPESGPVRLLDLVVPND